MRWTFDRLRSSTFSLLVVLFLSLGISVACAQSVLSPAAEATVKRLSSLNSLPLVGWRYHKGDLAHAESTDLDDSQWQLANDKVEVGNDAVWFRRAVEVPKTLDGYDLSGSRIWFKFDAGANGPRPADYLFQRSPGCDGRGPRTDSAV